MNREKAVNLMHDGEKLTHDNFSGEEWMTIENGKFLFEDGCICSYGRFWESRPDIEWDEGWELY